MRNQLRIDFAIDMFKNNSHKKISIEGIATESGFNNRATFYKAFREVTNTTPIEWINANCEHTLAEEELE
jgi:AraC-like DNA-binding protein